MSKNLLKSTFREIRSSLGRFGAILAIIVLGVGLFSGLGICRETMIKTVDDYMTDRYMYDYQLISTLGITSQDVQAFLDLDGVINADGAYLTDALVYSGIPSEKAMRIHSVTRDINRLEAIHGRLPRAGDECVGDPRYYSEADIGTVVHISKNNDEDTLKALRYDEYTLVGIADFPFYLNIERGTTRIGSGSISAYLCIPEEGFDSEVFHELYIRADSQGKAYSDEYEDFIRSGKAAIQSLLQERADLRHKEIETEILDGQREIENGRQELADARTKIKNGRDEIEAAKADIIRARDELSKAREQLEAQLAAGGMSAQGLTDDMPVPDFEATEQELDAAEREIAEKERELSHGERQIENNERELLEAEADIPDIPKPADTYVLTREENVGYRLFKNDSNVVSEVAKIFPVFFFLVAALVCVTTMSRMIDEQRSQIGILKSLGYASHSIIGKYFIYSGGAGIIGCLIGFFGGTALIPWVVSIAYSMAYTFLGGFTFIFNMPLMLISVAVSLLCTIGITWTSCRSELRNTPARLMRPKAPKAGKRILLERVTPIWKRLPFLQKLTFRNLFRYKRRFFMMILGISGCTALLVAGLGIRDSFMDVADNQYDKIYLYDAQVNFSGCLTEAEQEKFIAEQGGQPLFASIESADVRAGDNSKSVSFIALPEAFVQDYIALAYDGKPLGNPGEDGVFIDAGLAEDLLVSKDSMVEITDNDGNTETMRVAGIYQNYIGNTVYLTSQGLEKHFDGFEVNGAYVFLEGDIYESAAQLLANALVSNVSLKEDARVRFNSTVSSLDSVVIMLVLFAGALAFVVIYNLTNINITERLREIATVKVLGFYDKESSSYVFRENSILAVLGAGVGLLLGRGLLAFVIEQLKVDGMNFTYHVQWSSYLLAVLLTLFFSFLVQMAVKGKLKRVNMAESLKTVE